MQNAVEMGDFLRAGFAARLSGNPGVKDIRGAGLMIGIELAHPCGELVQQALDKGLLINVTADNVVRLLPPLNFTREQAELVIDMLAPLILDFLSRQPAPQPAVQPA